MTIGPFGAFTLQMARETAQRMRVDVAQGTDPLSDKQADRATLTVNELSVRYIEEHAKSKKKPKSVYLDEVNLKNYVLPNLGSLRISEVSRNDISSLHHKMIKTPYQANRVLALISKMFNLAEKWGIKQDGSNPCIHVEKFAEKKIERYLSTEEFSRLSDVLHQAKLNKSEMPSVITAIMLLIYTGARLNEILTLKWEYVKTDQSCLQLPDSKTGAKTIFLSPQAIEIIDDTERLQHNPYVITGRKKGTHLVNIGMAWRRIRKTAKIDDVRIHDLRHSFASIAVNQGMSLPMIGALLGHTQSQTTARYAHLANDPLKNASNLIGDQISEAMK